MYTAKHICALLLLLSGTQSASAADFLASDSVSGPSRARLADRVVAPIDAAHRDGYAVGSSVQLPLRAQDSKPVGASPSPARSNLIPAEGLHLSYEGERPSLAYRFSENGVIRLRGNVHEPKLVFSWSY